MNPLPPIEVAVLVYEGVNLLNVSGVVQSLAAYEHADREIGEAGAYLAAQPRYHTTLLSTKGGNVMTSAGVAIGSDRLSKRRSAFRFHTLVIPGGRGVVDASKDEQLRRWLQNSVPLAQRICAIGSGSYLLADCGLLDGREIVTHWNARLSIQHAFPKVHVLHNHLFMKDGKFWSSAGVAATIDMALAILEEDVGRAKAMSVARHLVVFVRRYSHQSQLSMALNTQSGPESRFDDLVAWMQEHLSEPLDVSILAARSHMSPRNFARCFQRETGLPPAQMLKVLRVEAASHALRAPGATVKQVAIRYGFGDEEKMRRAFHAQFGVPPNVFGKRSSERPQAQ